MNKNRTRTHDIHLRLNDKEYKTLESRRAKCKLSQQTYLRKLVMDEKPREAPSADFIAFHKELKHIKTELADLAFKASEEGVISSTDYWTSYKNIERLIHKFFSAIMFPEWVMEEIMKENSKRSL